MQKDFLRMIKAALSYAKKAAKKAPSPKGNGAQKTIITYGRNAC